MLLPYYVPQHLQYMPNIWMQYNQNILPVPVGVLTCRPLRSAEEMKPRSLGNIRALLFDVFGTCVDWRTAIINEGTFLANKHELRQIDWAAFADAWRGLYHPQMELVRSGQRPWVKLDILHRESLSKVAEDFGIGSLASDVLDEFNRVWHRLDPWPDTVAGLQRLKRKFIIAPNSNGHIALIVAMAKRASIPWDTVLGAEIARAYKPMPEEYQRNVAALDLKPEQVMMVAAHNYDLVGASKCGLRTAFVLRRHEFGPGQTSDLGPAQDYDINAQDFEDLATQLGA